jgi:hypothetical protein
MTHNWTKTKDLLVAGSTLAFKAFFAVHPIETVRAIGYTWEWGQGQACFYSVANTQKGLEAALADANRYEPVALTPEQAMMKVRWNAGYFPFPAGLTGPNDEMGADWEAEAARLYDLTVKMSDFDTSDEAAYADYGRQYDAFLAELVAICCEALIELSNQGVFSGATQLDFYVGSTDEYGDIIISRDGNVRSQITNQQHIPS